MPQKNMYTFYQAAWNLRDAGYNVVNPWELDLTDKKSNWFECLRRDIKVMMECCNSIATLPGWRKSKGALLEIYIAKQLNWPVKSVNEWRKKANASSNDIRHR